MMRPTLHLDDCSPRPFRGVLRGSCYVLRNVLSFLKLGEAGFFGGLRRRRADAAGLFYFRSVVDSLVQYRGSDGHRRSDGGTEV